MPRFLNPANQDRALPARMNTNRLDQLRCAAVAGLAAQVPAAGDCPNPGNTP